jgi:hypothetical protein
MEFNYDKDKLIKDIYTFRNDINLDTVYPIELCKMLDKAFPIIPYGVDIIKKGTPLYRGRVHEGGTSYKKVTDFSYVPYEDKKKCGEFGRANLPKQSLFYSSNDMDTAQMETICKQVDKRIWPLSFGKWVIEEDIIIAKVLPADIKEINAVSNGAERKYVHESFKKDLSSEQHECADLVTDFIGREFAKTDIKTHRHYLYSVYFANRLFLQEENGQKLQGVRYPSIPMVYQGDNFVLKPDMVDQNKLRLDKTYEVVSGIGGQMKLESRIENTSVKIENGEITWQKNDVVIYR